VGTKGCQKYTFFIEFQSLNHHRLKSALDSCSKYRYLFRVLKPFSLPQTHLSEIVFELHRAGTDRPQLNSSGFNGAGTDECDVHSFNNRKYSSRAMPAVFKLVLIMDTGTSSYVGMIIGRRMPCFVYDL